MGCCFRWLSDLVNPAINCFHLWASGVSKLEAIASNRYIHSIASTDVEFVDRFTLHSLNIAEELILDARYWNTGCIAEVIVCDAKHSCAIHVLTDVKIINA